VLGGSSALSRKHFFIHIYYALILTPFPVPRVPGGWKGYILTPDENKYYWNPDYDEEVLFLFLYFILHGLTIFVEC